MLKRSLLLLLLANGMSLMAMESTQPSFIERIQERARNIISPKVDLDSNLFWELKEKLAQMPSVAPSTLEGQKTLEAIVGKDFADRYKNMSADTALFIVEFAPGFNKEKSTPEQQEKVKILLKTIELLQTPRARL